jgi:hypothetical protein
MSAYNFVNDVQLAKQQSAIDCVRNLLNDGPYTESNIKNVIRSFALGVHNWTDIQQAFDFAIDFLNKARILEVSISENGVRTYTLLEEPKTSSKTFYQDDGHGWLEVPRKECAELGILDKISGYSYQKGDFLYLEEDCDLECYLNVFGIHGCDAYNVWFAKNVTVNRASGNSPVRNFEHYRKEQ